MEQFTSQQVFRAVDDVVASLGYDSIKQKQRAVIIETFTKGKDVFISLPILATSSHTQSALMLVAIYRIKRA